MRHAVGTGRGAVRESWRRLAVAKRKVLTRVANSPERNNQVGGVAVLRCNLGCFGTKCFATRSQDTLTRRVTTTQRWPVVVEVFLTRLMHVVGRCGGRPGGRGWRSLRVAAAAGSPHPPLSDRRTGCTVSSRFESLYLTLIRTSHTSTQRRVLPNGKRGGGMVERHGLWPGVVALTGDADGYCVPCAMERYGEQVIQAVIDGGPGYDRYTDREGNPFFVVLYGTAETHGMYCGDCGIPICDEGCDCYRYAACAVCGKGRMVRSLKCGVCVTCLADMRLWSVE